MNFILHKLMVTRIKRYIILVFVCNTIAIGAQNTPGDEVNLDKIPPRIIRACCAFGYDLKLWGVPFVNIDQVISIDDLGAHHYMSNKSEGIGTIYTNKGGFIDVGHLRDQIDWTRYLYTIILYSRGKGEIVMPLRKEAGRKTLYLNIPEQFDDNDCMLLAGKITYDFSLWHEISTWYGASTVPLMSEKFSSFSVEDVYSNLLGIHVGMKALQSNLPFNQAATEIIASSLDSLAVVKTAQETYDAYDAVKQLWYTDKKRIPRKSITLKRDPDVLTSSRPWLVPNNSNGVGDPVVLEVPLITTKGDLLTNYYQFTIDLNHRIPVKEIFPEYENSRINQDDFGVLLTKISNELQIMEQSTLAENKEYLQK
ncbi:DUF4056 domain-containing protein [Aurantibacter crassamenti]|uniref:DUF4056 domain-containing protein n=1 Tax=Aurantibacter crassamenti TaxID=1837375 RepID=UPI00193954E3|nr:DUF4056 domain-containing protein [Aurantibacter crassamenti]MBM1107030.1 DUF4056 domain-containing protein [Aurantibacter crassamenti]